MRFAEEDLLADRVPDGVYELETLGATQRCNDNGNEVVAVALAPVSEEHAWLRITDYFVIAGANPQASRVGRRRLARLLRACGVDAAPNVELDLAELLRGRSVRADLRYDEQAQRMRIRSYRPIQ